MQNSRDKYLANVRDFHKRLEELITDKYKLKVTHTNPMTWGYTTTAFFVETTSGNFVAKLTNNASDSKLKNIQREIAISELVKNAVPTSEYVRNTEGNFITPAALPQNSLLRLTKYIKGVPPFDCNLDILGQVTQLIKTIHNIPYNAERARPAKQRQTATEDDNIDYKRAWPSVFPSATTKTRGQALFPLKLNHGDLTPSNVLISHGKVVAITDFEEAVIALPEWDLSRMAVFFWFRTHDKSFAGVLKFIVEKYDNKSLDLELILNLSIAHARKHLENIVSNKARYENTNQWSDEYNFASESLHHIERLRAL